MSVSPRTHHGRGRGRGRGFNRDGERSAPPLLWASIYGIVEHVTLTLDAGKRCDSSESFEYLPGLPGYRTLPGTEPAYFCICYKSNVPRGRLIYASIPLMNYR